MVGCGGGGGGDSAPVGTVTNTPPVAAAGVDQNVSTGSLVTLDGSQSSDPQGDLLTYFWVLVAKPGSSTATLSNPLAAKPTFAADIDGVYTLALVVSDGALESTESVVTITATTANAAPVANAGADQSVLTGALVTLDGTGSSDADLDPITYTWSFTSTPATSTAALSDTTAAKPTFTADVDGDYVLSLTVNDSTVDSAADSVTVTARTANAAPVANAGADRGVSTGSTVALDGSASSDADFDPLTFSWSFTSIPAGSATTLLSAYTAAPSFIADVDGDYVVRLIVNDGFADSAAATITVTAVTGNVAPVANAGADQTVAANATVPLDGSKSSDADLDALTYSWSIVSKPAGSAAVLSNPSAVKPTFLADLGGDYVFQLVVNDGAADSPADVVTVQVLASNILWFADLATYGGAVDSSPAVDVNNQVFVKDTYCVTSLSTGGTAKWEQCDFNDPPFSNKPRTAVTPGNNGYVYVGYEDGYVRPMNDNNLGVASQKYFTGGSYFSDLVLSDQGDLYFGADDGKLYMREPVAGGASWTYQTGGVVGTPAIAADGTVYFGSEDNSFYALDSLGVLKWSVSFIGGIGKPVVGSDGTVYVTGYYSSAGKKELVALNPDGTEKWTFVATPSLSGAAAIGGDGTVYVVSEGSIFGGLYALDPADGTQTWLFSTGVATHGSPVLTTAGFILLGAEGTLYSVSPAGVEHSNFVDFSGNIIGSPAIGPDGTVYMTTDWNRVLALYGSLF